jgi:hypothetical protein
MAEPRLRLVSRYEELLISIDARSWGVLHEPDLFPEGLQLLKVFGVSWNEPSDGILQHMAAQVFRECCETVWRSFLRDQELLSFSYLSSDAKKVYVTAVAWAGASMFAVLVGSIKTKPTGYCTLRLRGSAPDSSGRFPSVEVIDLRKERTIETDDAGFLKVHRRAMTIDWYREMPRVLDFCDQCGADWVEVRSYDS